MQETKDIIIVGGGMVGMAMAAGLAESEFSIGVLEKSAIDHAAENTLLMAVNHAAPTEQAISNRVSAISPANQGWLTEIGCWDRIPRERIADYDKMHVWDANGSGQVTFDAADLAEPKLGSIIENSVLTAALRQRVAQQSNVQILDHCTIDELETTDDLIRLNLNDGRRAQAKLLIGADGALSQVRQKLGFQLSQSPYAQTAIVANVEVEKPHQSTAWQRFLSDGPLAFLPLPDSNLCSIVWSIDSDKADHLLRLSQPELSEQLTLAFENRLGKVRVISEVNGFPLVARHSQRYLAKRCALIGDAAHTIHPLAGQGVNLGFADARCLSSLLKAERAKGRDFARQSNLRPFERERKAENSLMLNLMSLFKEGFATQRMSATLLRSYFMNQVDSHPLMKSAIVKRAMGMD